MKVRATWQAQEGEKVRCTLCPHLCVLAEGQRGLCDTRVAEGGVLYADNFAELTSMALDPIEKKPLYQFQPGRRILSVGSWGCNLRCPFCQNAAIAWGHPETRQVLPEALVDEALRRQGEGNIGLAFTYNEPLTAYEYLMAVTPLAREAGLKNVLVSNGMINEAPLERLAPWLDAANIDLKSFRSETYRHTLGGDLATVQRTIQHLLAAGVHVEVTTLVVPGMNDDVEEVADMSRWLAGIDCRVPLHLTRFFPRHQWQDRGATAHQTLLELAEVAGRHLTHVYLGNI